MATAPQIAFRDGSGFTTNLVFNTNASSTILTGTIASDTSAIQISVNGGPWVTDPTLIKLDLLNFTIPNPANYPEGLFLEIGQNTIALRVIDIVGAVSGASLATITRIENLTDANAQIPSAIKLHRQRDTVRIMVGIPLPIINAQGFDPSNLQFIGYNFYASDSAAGATGYFKVNEKPVKSDSTTFEDTVLVTYDDTTTWTDPKLANIRIKVTEEDEFGNTLGTRLDQVLDATHFFNKVKYTSKVEDFRTQEFVSFTHNRKGGFGIINSDQWVTVADTSPLYYVVSGVYFDPFLHSEIETPFSQEVLGLPLILDTAIRDLPGRNANQVTLDYMLAIVRVNEEVALIPGSTSRDVSIDPFASEAERLWFILDFIHKSQSFITLLQVDDVTGSGTSDLVLASAYKTAIKAALGFTTDAAVQSLIDTQFDKLARNAGKTRLPGRPSIGQVIVASAAKPTKDIVIPAGAFVTAEADSAAGLPAVRYRVGGSFVIPVIGNEAFYNFDTKQYEVSVDITAVISGVAGNRSAGSITKIQGVAGVTVTNRASTVFGTDVETNAELAARAMLGYVSVDTGTEGGYAATTAEQVGILKAKIVKSGDPLMMRDYDDVRNKHIGGKVDIWVQGLRERQVSENFAFTFEVARDIRVQIIDLPTLKFRVLDSRVTPNTPIIEILNNLSQGLGVHNATNGLDYDLTGVVILDYQTFRISTSIAQPVTFLDDVIYVDYRFRVVNHFLFSYQPVRRVVSVLGESAGALTPDTGYQLYKNGDPLLVGESTIAEDFLSITPVDGKPSGDQIPVNNEIHIMIGLVLEPLDSIGINSKTIRVFNEQRTVEFAGPEAAVPDFEIVEGTPTTPVKILRAVTSTILNGQTVSVDYVHDENFTVTYVINDLLQELQQVVNVRRHATADVLVKQTVLNPVNIETTVQLRKGATKNTVDPAVRSAVSLILNQKLIGQGVAQSNVDAAINDSTGVEFNVLPLAKMAYADGSRRLRESLTSFFQRIGSLDIGAQRVFILTAALENPTTDGGGLATEHKGVFQDDIAMTLSASFSTVGQVANSAFIIGNAGAILAGYSDDATLTAEGFTTSKDREAERLRRTANHILVALPAVGLPLDEPSRHTYTSSYVIRGDKGSHDITAADVEFIDLGDLTVTYRSAT